MSTSKKVWLIICIIASVVLTVLIGLGAFFLLKNRSHVATVDDVMANQVMPDSDYDYTATVPNQQVASLPQSQMVTMDVSAVNSYLSDNNIQVHAMLYADVAALDGKEMICLATNAGSSSDEILCRVVGIQNNAFRILNTYNLGEQSIYLIRLNGQDHLLWYRQLYQNNITTYEYELLRYDNAGLPTSVDRKQYSYRPDQQDATAAATFFNALGQYTDQMTVIGDPYRLTGRQWLSPDLVAYGTPPAESATGNNERLGYVQIKDPKSWLNLREGPGTNYPCIYMEPGNKKSIVKQAQGSPVTILETVNTGDAKNPVWYKIRINYAGQEIVGYSSQTFIRLAN